GTLFTLAVGSTLVDGSGTVTIDAVSLRDCANSWLPAEIGTAATVLVDRSAPSVALLAPNGGESWAPGSVHAITWTASDAEGIALDVSTDDGASWQPVASGLSNSGSYDWTVPGTPSTSARVRVTARDVHDNAASDASDAAFTIQAQTTTSLATSPNPSVTGE